MATNRSPGPTSRLSKVTPLTSNGALAVPPVAAAISSDGPEPSCGALPRHERVVEGQHAVADDLASLVPLAGDEDDVAGAGDADRFADRFATARHLGRAWLRRP